MDTPINDSGYRLATFPLQGGKIIKRISVVFYSGMRIFYKDSSAFWGRQVSTGMKGKGKQAEVPSALAKPLGNKSKCKRLFVCIGCLIK